MAGASTLKPVCAGPLTQKIHGDDLIVNLNLPARLAGFFLNHGAIGRNILALLSASVLPIEVLLLRFIDLLPVRFRSAVVALAWRLWLALHRRLPSKLVCRGLSKDLSLESHALSNVLWWARLFPMTLRRVRFGLDKMDSICPPSNELQSESVNSEQFGARGTYLHISQSDSPRVIFWMFGGAYLGGSTRGTLGLAERHGRALDCDVFLVDMRLCPEYCVEDAFRDACRGYEWLLSRVPSDRIVFYGMSSGGGIALRVLQLAKGNPVHEKQYFLSSDPLPQPAGAVLCGPFVKYTQDVEETLEQDSKLDLVVNQSVYEFVMQHVERMCGGGGESERRSCSPIYHDMTGLCPLLISASDHEVCIHSNRELVERAKEAGVKVSFDTTPFMPHAFQWMSCLVPEAEKAEGRIVDWIKQLAAWNEPRT